MFRPTRHIFPKFYDAGDFSKHCVAGLAEKVVREGRRLVCLGGDHSITFEVLRGIGAVHPISFVYFDAHPDFACPRDYYHGGIICDSSGAKHLNLRRGLEIGIRVDSPAGLLNQRKGHLKTITLDDFLCMGVRKTSSAIKKLVTKPFYISIDMDVLDPAVAPGVSTPVPAGMSGADLLYLVKSLAADSIGLDIVELNPRFDTNCRTSELAVKLILDACARWC
jgi:agmatinase